jgi:thiosulfate/3-mercaptopyruvate sulfurtransferase
MINPIVTSSWLNDHINDKNTIILEAFLEQNQADLVGLNNIQISGSRLFDIKNTFSDTNNSLPNTFPTEEKFTIECQKLGIHKNSKIIVYDCIGMYASPRVWWMFKTMGHENILVLEGGLPQWIKEGYTIQNRIVKKYAKGNFQAKLQPKNIKNIAQVHENISTNKALLIDARSEERFNGTIKESRLGLRNGHIPKSINIPYNSLQKEGKFKSKSELAELLKFKEQPLIFSCGSGITACIVLLACELISENPKSVYDGSWTEWASSNLPIEK